MHSVHYMSLDLSRGLFFPLPVLTFRSSGLGLRQSLVVTIHHDYKSEYIRSRPMYDYNYIPTVVFG